MEKLRQYFAEHGQEQVFRFFDDLLEEEKETLVQQASEIDLEEITNLVASNIKNPSAGNDSISDGLSPAEFTPLPCNGGDIDLWEKASSLGEEALRSGRVCAFTVAGGQGTRLGFSGPKGTFGVTPVLKKSLFQVFAEKILAASQRYGNPIHWFILTSTINHSETIAFFEKCNYFGLDREKVHFLIQGLLPAVDEEGKILLAEKGSIALSPDGHGGSLRALVRSGSIDLMEKEGIDIISYFQVDNPLVRCIDPEFIGFHLLGESELTSKALPKAYPEEKVGIFCEQKGLSLVIEYSDMPERLMIEEDTSGDLKFRGGSIAIHLFDRNFVRKLVINKDSEAQLPFHVAKKEVAFTDTNGNRQTPDGPNAYKFEMFVFDSLPFAKNPVIIETAREDDFSPVKNAEGVDSPDTCRDDQLRQFARWAKAAGIDIETDTSGLPTVSFEISPLFADTEESFIAAWKQLEYQPPIIDNLVLA